MEKELPLGWFDEKDVKEYRRLFELLPNDSSVLELGCYRGRSLCSVADIIKKKNIKVYVVDVFTGTASEGFYENDYRWEFEKNIKDYNFTADITQMKTSKASEIFKNEMFGLIFIDAGHTYSEIKEDIEKYLPKLKRGGIISGHDYIIYPDVKRAVDLIFPDAIINHNIWSRNLII